MSVLRGISFLALLTFGFVLQQSSAYAEPVTVNGGKIRIQAEVLPSHKIVLDASGEIAQIYSNTTEDVAAPRVYRNSVAAANELPPSEAVLNEYRRLVLPGQSRIGTLYDRDSVTRLLLNTPLSLYQPAQPKLLAFD